MEYKYFLIAPINSGLQTNLKPFLIPDDAFQELRNAYVFRGRVRKRFGSSLMNGEVASEVAPLHSRLRILIGTTDGAGDLPPTVVPGSIFVVGQMFSIDDEMFTVVALGNPGVMLTTGAATVHTYDTTTGTVTINGAAPTTDVYFYPATPVMGLLTYETGNINDEPTYGFDTQFSYQYVNGGWDRLGTAVWTGSDSEFFWGYTYRGSVSNLRLLFVTNFNADDQIKYWDGIALSWTTRNFVYNATGNTVETGRIIVGFQDRLLILNTIEDIGGLEQFGNRCRFSQNGDPTAADAWREDIPGKGGYIDNVSTSEQIITAEFLKNRLIVFFERSTWELVYTGNEILPFRWQQINTELGAESTFSVVPFDKVTLGVGNVGIHACNGSNVERIDDKIPDAVFEVSYDNEGVFRVYGIRDYFTEMVYWTFPAEENDSKYPNRVLIYNYKNGSWAFNDDSITCFGYFQNPDDITWGDAEELWGEYSAQWNDATLDSKFRQVLAGNQEGFVFIIDSEISRNAPSLQITNVSYPSPGIVELIIINHNLKQGDFIAVENIQGSSGVNNPEIFKIEDIIDNNTIQIYSTSFTGVYTGGGTVSLISRIDLLTKQYNFFMQMNKQVYIEQAEFYVDRTAFGEITVDYFPSATQLSMIQQGQLTGSILGDNILQTTPFTLLEAEQDRFWHITYPQTEGEVLQFHIYLTDAQMGDTDIAWSPFVINAMLFKAVATNNFGA